MTGFARARRALDDGELVVSVKSVNHRALDLLIQAPSVLDPLEAKIRSMVKAKMHRGHVEVRVSLPKSLEGEQHFSLNREFLHQYLSIFQEEAKAHSLDSHADLNAALRIPGMLVETKNNNLPNGTEEALEQALQDALEENGTFRAREGGEIATELTRHNTQIRSAAEEMETLRRGATEYFQNRLHERLREIAKGVAIDPQRLAQEAALLADRGDIGEELARLKIHASQLQTLIDAGGEVGKKLDFLLQEMNRESNTVLSKTSGAGVDQLRITELALATKAAIEKIREQSLNVE